MQAPPFPRLHIVTNDSVLARPDVLDVASSVLEAAAWHYESTGVACALHLRGPTTTGRRLFDLGRELRTRHPAADLVVNDRVDVAMAVGTHVHLAARSIAPARARAMVPNHVRVGRSWHGDDSDRFEALQADYVFLGSLFATASHPGAEPLGVKGLERAVTSLPRADERAREATVVPPIVAIGGISPARIGVLFDAGATGVAVIRAVWHAPSPADAVLELLDGVKNSRGRPNTTHAEP